MVVGIEPARSTDVSAILSLLAQHGLPEAGLDAHFDTTVVAREEDRVVGCAAVEPYGAYGLLRSVAVDEARRGTGIGARLATAAIELARGRDITTLYLLTETAAEFFPRFGFRVIPRAEVAAPVRQSVEFRGACAESATVMVKDL